MNSGKVVLGVHRTQYTYHKPVTTAVLWNFTRNISLDPINVSFYSSNDLPDDEKEGFYFYENIDNLKKPWVSEPHVLPLVIVYGSLFLFGIVGNLAVIFAVAGGRPSRSVTFSFMVNLAVSDILFLLVCVPHETLRMVLGEWGGGRAFCKISGFIEMLTAVASVLNLTAVSFERYFVIAMPLQSRYRCTFGTSKKILLFLWFVSCLISSPAFYVNDTETTTYFNNQSSVSLLFCADNGLSESMRIYFAIYQLLVMYAVPMLLMTYCYVVVIYVLWISRKTLFSLTPNSRNGHTDFVSGAQSRRVRKYFPSAPCAVKDGILKGRKQVIRLLITLIIVFLVCWGPKLFLQLIKRTNPEIYQPEVFNLQVAIYCLPYIQSCSNPLIYCIMSRTFRHSLRSSWRNLVQRCRGSNSLVPEFELQTRSTLFGKRPNLNRCSTSSS